MRACNALLVEGVSGIVCSQFPEQSDLDCLAAFGCSSLNAEPRRAWELSRLAAGHRGAASALTTSSPAYPSGDEGQRVVPVATLGPWNITDHLTTVMRAGM